MKKILDMLYDLNYNSLNLFKMNNKGGEEIHEDKQRQIFYLES